MRLIVTLMVVVLTLSACVSSGGSSVGSPTQAQQFMSAVENKRGTALSFAERVQVQGLASAAAMSLDSAQQSFLNKVGAQVGLDGAVLAALFPEVGKPISQTSAVQRVQSKMKKRLSAADAAAISAATALRNNSVASLKSGLASSIGSRIGMDSHVVLALMPLLGF